MDNRLSVALPPGIWRNGTRYQAKGRWYDANLVRFFDGTIRPVGGWRRLTDSASTELAQLTGVPRAALAFRMDGGVTEAVATTDHLYVISGGDLHDVTPLDLVAGPADTGPADAATVGQYNVGLYNVGLYGTGSPTVSVVEAGLWSLDNFGNDLVAVSTADRRLLVWAGDPAVRAAVAANSPQGTSVVVTPERFLVVLGADGDVRKVAWASQETTTDWTPSDLNTAGDFSLATNGRLLAGRVTKGQTLLFTDADVHTMTYIGGTFVYRFSRVGENCGLLAPNAVVTTGGAAYWMSTRGFHKYDGYVSALRCDVEDHIFSDLNFTQAAKCWGMSVSAYNEVWFFYPSAASNEVDRYAVYNYVEDHWTVGQLARTAGFDRGAVQNPVMVDPDGFVFEHDLDASLSDARDNVYIESGPFELDEGDRVVQVQRFIPDAKNLGDVELTMYTADNPTENETTITGPFPLTAVTDLRIAARQARFRIQEHAQSAWRVGTLRFSVVPSSRR